MTPTRCPGGPQFRHARAAKSHAWASEPDRSKRPVAVRCDGHWHLTPRDTAPTNDQPRS
jgi:hypothetical protein